MIKLKSLLCALVSFTFVLLLSLNVFAAEKFNHAEYLKPKTADSANKKDTNPIKGEVAFDQSAKTLSFVDQKGAAVVTIPYDKIKSMLYEKTSRPRYAEGLLLSPFFLFTKTKKHFLTVQYTDSSGNGQFVVIHMDKSNARDIVATAEADTGKKVDVSEEK